MPGDSYDAIRDSLALVPRVRRQTGIFMRLDGNLAVVKLGDQRVSIPMVGYVPFPGSPVWVDTQNGRTVCAGSSYQFSPYGTVQASPSGGRVQVKPDDGPVLNLPYRSGLSLTSGNRVEINPTSYVVQGLISVTPDAPEDDDGGGTGSSFTNLLVQAVNSGTSNGGAYWQNNVNCDSTAGGAWFYGSRAQAAFKGVKTFTKFEMYLPQIYKRTAGNPSVRLHTSSSRPSSGLPSFGSTSSFPVVNGWTRIPLSWAEYLRDNNGGFGFSPTSGVFMSWRGTDSDRMSGALRVSGTR